MTATTTTPRTPAVIRWLVLATFIVILNETVLFNAIPRLMIDLDISATAAQWLSTAFMLTMAAVIPITGWFLQRVTTRTAFTVAMCAFSVGTALAIVAPGFEVLLAARIIQASGTAVMMPLLMTTLMTVVPESDRGRVMGNVTLAISVAPAMGPALSGIVLQFGSWRLLYVVVLPLALGVMWAALRRLENVGETKPGFIDWFSVGLAGLGFGGLVYGLTGFGEAETPGVRAAALIVVAGVLAIGGFALRQRGLMRSVDPERGPLMDLRILNFRTYALALALMSISFMAMMGSLILLPLYLQEVRGLSALQTGLLVMPGGLAMGLLGPQVGKVYDRLGARILVIPGTVVMVGSLTLLTQVSASLPYALVLAAHIALMVSLAMVFTPSFTLGLGVLTPALYSHGSSMLGTLQQVAAAFGTALAITIMTSRGAALVDGGATETAGLLGGIQLAFAVSAVISVGAILIAVRMPHKVETAPDTSELETEPAQT